MKRGFAGADRALFWTFAVVAFAVAAAGFAARAVDRAAQAYDDSRNAYAIVRVLAPDGPAGMSAAEVALSRAPHVSSAAPMTSRRAAALIEQWTGHAPSTDMPPLRLIELELEPSADQSDVTGDITAALAQGGVTGEVILPPGAASGGGLSLGARQIAIGAAGLFALVMALIVALAARALAARREDLIAVLADLGATSGQAAGRVGDEAAMLGFQSGLIGAIVAGLGGVAALLLLSPGATVSALPHLITPIDAAPLVLAPILIAIAAALGARAGAESVHAQAARLA